MARINLNEFMSIFTERDEVINVLYQQSSATTNGETETMKVKQLEIAMSSLVSEKEQILSVISEKTRENRKLKDDIHKMMDVIAAEKNALAKVSC